MQRFDDLWTDTTSYADYANVTGALAGRYPLYPIAPELNFPPAEAIATRAVAAYNAEPSAIDAIMYRITDRAHTDAMIAAVQRGVPVRLITEQEEYRNPARLWHAWNVDRLCMAGVQIRDRAHAGLNHQKSVLLRGQDMAIFGSSNWTSPSTSRRKSTTSSRRAVDLQWFKAAVRSQVEQHRPDVGDASRSSRCRRTRPHMSRPPTGAAACRTTPSLISSTPARSRTSTTSISEPRLILRSSSTTLSSVRQFWRRPAALRASRSAAQYGVLLADRRQDYGA